MANSSFQLFWRKLTSADRELLLQLAAKLIQVSAGHVHSSSQLLADWQKRLHQAMPALSASETEAFAITLTQVAANNASSISLLQEKEISLNLQYLQLQSALQNENRQFTMVSNIMKTKHDTVKNSISNIH